jgi:hypothetical protein
MHVCVHARVRPMSFACTCELYLTFTHALEHTSVKTLAHIFGRTRIFAHDIHTNTHTTLVLGLLELEFIAWNSCQLKVVACVTHAHVSIVLYHVCGCAQLCP